MPPAPHGAPERRDAPGQYFATRPAVPSAPGTVRLALPERTVELGTDRGVFAATAVDPGTRVLLADAAMPSDDDRVVVDLGCGYGPIAVAVALRTPHAQVWAIDVNERARHLCRANASAAGAANVVVVAPDDVPAALGVDRLYSNPPIRIGKAPLQELLVSWLARLRPGGRATIVVHKHLGSDSLARWLESEGWPTSRVASRQGYRILDVVSPILPPGDGH